MDNSGTLISQSTISVVTQLCVLRLCAPAFMSTRAEKQTANILLKSHLLYGTIRYPHVWTNSPVLYAPIYTDSELVGTGASAACQACPAGSYSLYAGIPACASPLLYSLAPTWRARCPPSPLCAAAIVRPSPTRRRSWRRRIVQLRRMRRRDLLVYARCRRHRAAPHQRWYDTGTRCCTFHCYLPASH
jgi:hypothetical protein